MFAMLPIASPVRTPKIGGRKIKSNSDYTSSSFALVPPLNYIKNSPYSTYLKRRYSSSDLPRLELQCFKKYTALFRGFDLLKCGFAKTKMLVRGWRQDHLFAASLLSRIRKCQTKLTSSVVASVASLTIASGSFEVEICKTFVPEEAST